MARNFKTPFPVQTGVANVRAVVRYQSCSDTVCFPPATRELTLAIAIVGARESVQYINGQYFGSGGKRAKGK
ncbi:MAG: hypothetical protein LC754_00630 [Acidobacteria bacterium]|nr:hypothetical protein [Acidobacteriota bacterium]